MPLNLRDEISECYSCATEARARTESATDPATKADHLDTERRWLFLARSYEFAERLSRFTEPFRKRQDSK
jgi:hypothetical protein